MQLSCTSTFSRTTLSIFYCFLWSLFVAISLYCQSVSAGPVSGLNLTWPVPSTNFAGLGQDYAAFSDAVTNKHHAGIDIPATVGTSVVAAAGGTTRVIKLSEMDNKTHCLGNVVIIDHGIASTLYAHLTISNLIADGVIVNAGDQIGEVGDTTGKKADGITDCTGLTGPHLHFELKDNPVLGTTSDDGVWWAYTPSGVGYMIPADHPDNFGFHDPVLNVTGNISFVSGNVVVTTNGSAANMRIGPDSTYRSIGSTIQANETYLAVREYNQSTASCSSGWLQIIETDGSYFTDSVSGGFLPDVWVCKGDSGENWVVYESSSGSSSTLVAAEAFLDNPSLTPGTGTALSLNGALSDPLRTASGSLDLSNVSPGSHTVYIRFKDNSGDWSTPFAQGFFVTEGYTGSPLVDGNNIVVSAEAFIDIDPGEGNAAPITVAADGAIDSAIEILKGSISMSGISIGVHVLHVRILDATGIWSPTLKQTFYVPTNQSGGTSNPALLVAAEGIVDGGTPIVLAADDGFFGDQIETATLTDSVTNDYHSAQIKFKDSLGLWGGDSNQSCYGDDMMIGQLIDSVNGSIMSGIDIQIDEKTVTTDDTGRYAIGDLPCGPHEIIVNVNGFEKYRRSVGIESDGWLDIRLTKESTTSGMASESAIYGDPVNTATGNYIYQSRDLEISGIGMTFRFERTYNSREAINTLETDIPMGYGWSHNLNIHLIEESAGIFTITWGDGHTETWTSDGEGEFISQYGVFDHLIDDGGGAYTLQKRNHTAYHFNASGVLDSISDKNSNTQTFSYTTGNLTNITDTAGRTISLTYDTANRLTQITDPINRNINFVYDANGNLISATNPNGNITAYTYDANHQILTVVDPRGNTVVNNTYDAAKRVVTYQTDAKGGSTTYNYQELDRITTITDALGNVIVHDHDELLRLVKEQDANGGITLYEYDASGNRVKVTDKNSNLTEYGYDVHGNVTTKTNALGNITIITYDANDNPLSRTDALGNTTHFTYDANGNLTQTTDALGNITHVIYDTNGLALTVTDALGNTTSNVYDVQGNHIQMIDALGNTSSHSYDGIGRRMLDIDPLGRSTQYVYDNNNNLLTITDPAGGVITYTYDANDNRLNSTDARGNTTQYSYDEKDLKVTTTDALGNITSNAYDAMDRRIAVTNANGHIMQFTYDPVGNRIQRIDQSGNTSQFTFDPNGNRITSTDPNGNFTSTDYDALNRKIMVTDALGNITNITYDAVGQISLVTGANGNITTNTYDELSRLIQTTNALGAISQTSYDANGNRITQTDANGNTSQYSYDALNRRISTTDTLGYLTSTTYDAVGNQLTQTDGNGNTSQFTYDSNNRLILTTNALGSSRQFIYDENGNQITETDSLGHITSTTYDANNRKTAVIDPLGNTTSTFYDQIGRFLSVTDAIGQVTAFEYNLLNELKKVTDAEGGTVLYDYDANGNRTGMTDPNDNTTNYTYDALNQKLTTTEPLGHVSSLQYDAVGNLSQRTDAKGQIIQYNYDSINQLVSTVYGPVTVNFTYDAVGNLLQMADSLGITSHSYDAMNRRISTNDPFGQVVQYGYDANDNRISLTYPGNKTVTYSYDAANRLSTVTDWLAHNTTYGYDLADRLITTTNANGTTTAYSYDNADRLTGLINKKSDTSVINSYAYTLDAVGNHTQEVRDEPLLPVMPADTVNNTLDAENRLIDSNSITNSFDANGNMTAKGSNSYSYDIENRMSQTNIGGTVTEYQYDRLGNRYVRTEGSITSRYILDTNTSLTNVLAETDNTGVVQSYNIYGHGLITRIAAPDSATFYHYDSRGSTIALTDITQGITGSYAYDPFGRAVNIAGGNSNPFRYLGKYGVQDEGDDLNYIRARYYDSKAARFFSKDLMAGSKRSTQTLNRYIYSLGNPNRFIDIDGYFAILAITFIAVETKVIINKIKSKYIEKPIFKIFLGLDESNTVEIGEGPVKDRIGAVISFIPIADITWDVFDKLFLTAISEAPEADDPCYGASSSCVGANAHQDSQTVDLLGSHCGLGGCDDLVEQDIVRITSDGTALISNCGPSGCSRGTSNHPFIPELSEQEKKVKDKYQ